MLFSKNTFVVKVESDKVSELDIVGANGKKIQIDTDYNKYKHSVQVGTIWATPIRITDGENDVPLNVGDKIIFHHFVCQPDHKLNIGENLYRCEYFNIYGKYVEDKLIPIETTIFIEPILEDEESLFVGKIRIKNHREVLKRKGIVYECSPQTIKLGLSKGDVVYYSSNADYRMDVDNKELYRMRLRNICAKEVDGKLIPLHNRIVVKETGTAHAVGIFLDVHKSVQKYGVVTAVGKDVEEIEVGMTISYSDSSVGVIEYQNNVYSFLELRNINYIKC